MIPAHLVEKSFFGLFLQELPLDLVGKNTPKHQNNIAALKRDIATITTKIEDTARLAGELDLDELKTRLVDLKAQRENKNGMLQEEIDRMRQESDLPSAVEDLKSIIKSDDGLEIAVAFSVMSQELKDQSVRAKILNLIPSLVNQLTIDLEKWTYTVTLSTGKQSKPQTIVNPKDIDEAEVWKKDIQIQKLK
jgi:hypothetical protein